MSESFCRRSVVVVMLLVATTAAVAQVTKGSVSVKIDSVLAADTNQGCDKALKTLRDRLRRLFHYTTYRLVKHDESHTGFGQTATFTLPGGRILHIEPIAMDGDMIRMEVMLFQGEEPMMTTDLKIMNRGIFMVGGPRYEQGTLIISITTESPDVPGDVAPPATAVSAPSAPNH
ncbi:MAG TPA: hypothetical protein VFE56_08010 [Candidatus Binataceae bacterium]|nr:hypothetical protein [Candidatus Binataceae bacterium]